jgi:hypothetical protein
LSRKIQLRGADPSEQTEVLTKNIPTSRYEEAKKEYAEKTV